MSEYYHDFIFIAIFIFIKLISVENDGLEDEMEDYEISAAFSSKPEIDDPEPQYDEPESQYDEPERPTPDAEIQQALQSKLEKDFGQLPPNVVIGGIPDHNSGYRSGTANGLGR